MMRARLVTAGGAIGAAIGLARLPKCRCSRAEDQGAGEKNGESSFHALEWAAGGENRRI
jgi:hypothetical protein